MAIDLALLWDFNQAEVSEQRFLAALQTAVGDDALILQTQIARTYGLRQEFSKARHLLRSIEECTTSASPEARVRFALELGRTHASATHPPQLPTAEEALALQLRLEREGDETDQPDPYVFEELEVLYRELGDEQRAQHYATRKESAQN